MLKIELFTHVVVVMFFHAIPTLAQNKEIY